MELIYLDNAATTYPKPPSVYDAINKSYINLGFNVGRGQYRQAESASALVLHVREQLLKLFNGNHNKRVIFNASATEAMNVVLQGLEYQDGYTVYITPFEHNAVLRTLHVIKKKHNINIQYLHVDKQNIEYDLEEIQIQFQNHPPNMVIMTHVSNVCGCITPIQDICTMAKGYDAITVVDSAQSAGLVDINLQEVEIDYLVFAGHKTLYGSFGIGGFICNVSSKLKPLIFGGTGIDSANMELPNTIPEKFEVGSPNIHAVAALSSGLEWIENTTVKSIYIKEKELTEKVINCLEEFNMSTVYKPRDRISVVSFNIQGLASDMVGKICNDKNIALRTGLHCAPEAHKFLGTFPSGTVRLSVSYFNTNKDIESIKSVVSYIYNNI